MSITTSRARQPVLLPPRSFVPRGFATSDCIGHPGDRLTGWQSRIVVQRRGNRAKIAAEIVVPIKPAAIRTWGRRAALESSTGRERTPSPGRHRAGDSLSAERGLVRVLAKGYKIALHSSRGIEPFQTDKMCYFCVRLAFPRTPRVGVVRLPCLGVHSRRLKKSPAGSGAS